MRTPARSIGVAVLVSLPHALAAQDLQTICRDLGKVTVGQWASHRLLGTDTGTTRFAIVSSEQQGGTTLYWYEMKIEKAGGTGDERGPMIIQLLVSGLGAGQAGEARAMVMKAGNQPAMRMPEQ
ncbi:MAG: hypothetical protein ACRDHF_18800, partial [Tepidiformaceae bacterium]